VQQVCKRIKGTCAKHRQYGVEVAFVKNVWDIPRPGARFLAGHAEWSDTIPLVPGLERVRDRVPRPNDHDHALRVSVFERVTIARLARGVADDPATQDAKRAIDIYDQAKQKAALGGWFEAGICLQSAIALRERARRRSGLITYAEVDC